MLYNFVVRLVGVVLWPIYRLKVVGSENIPKGPAVVCGNHTANIDSVMLFLAFKLKERPAVIAKAELFKTAIARWFFPKMGIFPVHRGKADLAAIKKSLSVLKNGQKLIIFPEGTRVKSGELGDGKSGAAMFAMRTSSPVLPVYITPGKKAFRGCTVTFGKPFYLPKPEKADAAAYKEAAEVIMQKIAETGEKAQ